MKKDEFIEVVIRMEIDGELVNMKKVKYSRGRQSEAFTLDDFAAIVFMWEKLFDGGSTYAMEGLMQKAEKKLPKEAGETAQSVFEKYWINLEKTINDEYDQRNKGDKNEIYPLFPAENDYLTHCIYQLCNHLDRSPLPVKYGFLHWLFKYIEHGSLAEFEADLKEIPDYIKTIVDTKVIEQEEPAK